MRILLTNDDGINAEGLGYLVQWAQKLGEVTVVAPKFEQSGKSHSIEIHKAFEVKQVHIWDNIASYSVDSTPADCIRFAFTGLKVKPDLVIAGINKGFNIGRDIVYSGTDGALFEAGLFNAKALAISSDPASFKTAILSLDRIYDFVMKNHLFDHNDLYNINIPLEALSIRITAQGGAYSGDIFVDRGNDLYQAQWYSLLDLKGNLNLDTEAVMNGYISITPLTLQRTAESAFESLANLND